MKILIAHNRYQQAGGEDSVVSREAAMLQRRDHEVELLLVDNDAIVGAGAQATAAISSFYSYPSNQRVKKLLQSFQPDILHVHNFLTTLSPSVFFAANAAHVPVVQTLHNYRLVCASASLFRDGAPCEECLVKRSFLPGVRHACYRGSRMGSAVIGAGMSLHAGLGTWRDRIDRYIALTKFAAEKLGQNRIPSEKICIKPNFVSDRGIGEGDGGFALYVGRLSEEKGLKILIRADAEGSLPLPIYIAGDGPLLETVLAACARPGSRLLSLGKQSQSQIESLMKQAVALLVPSLWYEGFPMVMVEALSFGLPIIASRIGGLPEIIEDQVSGLLCKPGSAASFTQALTSLVSEPEQTSRMRRAARNRYIALYTEQANYEALMKIYGTLMPGYIP